MIAVRAVLVVVSTWFTGSLFTVTPELRATQAPTPRVPLAEVRGFVGDSAGTPIEGARIEILPSGMTQRTTRTGAFRFEDVPTGRASLLILALGYARQEVRIAVLPDSGWTGRVIMQASAQTLPTVQVEGEIPSFAPRLADFERRRRRAFGVFLDEQDIRDRHPVRFADLLKGIAGVKVYFNSWEFTRCRERVGVWIDGNRHRGGMPINVRDIVALEVYRGVAQLPAEFLEDNCAAIVIWTR